MIFFIAFLDILPPYDGCLRITGESCTGVKNCFHFVKLFPSHNGNYTSVKMNI